MSHDNFAELFAESLQGMDLRKGALIKAEIIDIKSDYVMVSAGLKSDAYIAAEEFKGEEVAVGDHVDVVVDAIENGYGETRLSREKARREQAWVVLNSAHENNTNVLGTITERVKGGFVVILDSIQAFLPGSLADIKPVRNPAELEGQELEFRIIKMDRKRNNVVVSRKAVLEGEGGVGREERMKELVEGQEVIGAVKNITDYGAFVDLGGVDGLLHITDMAWKRVKHPSELLTVGEELRVKVLKVDQEKNRVSLGLKQLSGDPWHALSQRFPTGKRIAGRVSNVTDYGCFVELEEGVEGLVHMSEMDWTNKNINPSKIVQPGQEVEVMVLDIDEDRRRISLGIKQCQINPWQAFSLEHKEGDVVKGNIRSITDFGVFVGLSGSIDGLVHLSDISWSESNEEAALKYKKGDEVTAVILAIDSERERISLGIKQLESDPVDGFLQSIDKSKPVEAEVVEVQARLAKVQLGDDILGELHISEYSNDHINELTDVLKVGDKLEVKILNADRKTRAVKVSHKAVESMNLAEALRNNKADVPTKATLGDLLKEKMQEGKDKKK